MSPLPATMPQTSEAAFAYIGTIETPSVDDLKLMVCLEASGQSFYDALAAGAPSEEIGALLKANGREEMAHARRLQTAIRILTGETFDIPTPDTNPYDTAPASLRVDVALLETMAAGEFGGEVMYEGWAARIGNEEVAKLLRQNGKEERRHGERAEQAKALMAA
ncbi:ferritin-like domain-containing protein [Emcibacter sp. SYSU 3D8]|uniref:ferritin-like domain-containing protein n=1 Tax=Emcibacter sp. SYSU 3D8 TaxID=3133969 RepID=UPI0031FED023